MTDHSPKIETDENGRHHLRLEEALKLARRGKGVWNLWVIDLKGKKVIIDFSHHDFTDECINFSGFIFPGDVSLSSCTFKDVSFARAKFSGGDADFSQTKFKGRRASFLKTEFTGGDADFSEALFRVEHAYFSRAKFSGGDAHFFQAVFEGKNTSFRWAEFSGGYADFSESEFSGGTAVFSMAKFSGGNAVFESAKFSGGDVDFSKAEFSGGDANFINSEFNSGNTNFQNATFHRRALFEGADFRHEVDFSVVSFKSAVTFKDAKFDRIPDFRYSDIKVHFSMHGMEVGFAPMKANKRYLFLDWKMAANRDHADKFRRLKELASNCKDHEREQNFFAKELMAKRFYETKNFQGLVSSILYQKCSVFGRSIARPFGILFSVWLVFGAGFWHFATCATVTILDGLRLSASVIMPFSATAKTTFVDAQMALYGDPPDLGLLFDIAVILEGLLSLTCVFLIGLALRNRFRI